MNSGCNQLAVNCYKSGLFLMEIHGLHISPYLHCLASTPKASSQGESIPSAVDSRHACRLVCFSGTLGCSDMPLIHYL